MAKVFHDAIATGYALAEPSLVIGSAMHDDELVNDARIQVALSMLNRHGLIAGATGTGKTKTLQLLAGQLSMAGVPVFVADIKGDVTGLGGVLAWMDRGPGAGGHGGFLGGAGVRRRGPA